MAEGKTPAEFAPRPEYGPVTPVLVRRHPGQAASAGVVEEFVGGAGDTGVDRVVPGVDGDLLGAPPGGGREMSRAGSMTCSLPQIAARWAAVAAGAGRPSAASTPRTAPPPVPYPQCTRVPNRFCSLSPCGWMPSTLPSAWAGAVLPPRPRSFISMVLLAVIPAVMRGPSQRDRPGSALIRPPRVSAAATTTPPSRSGPLVRAGLRTRGLKAPEDHALNLSPG